MAFVSDHGYHLGQHGLWQKSDLFEGSARVPLIIAPPEYEHGGEAHAHPTELVDLYPTLAGFSGLETPKHVMGKSLVPVLESPGAHVRDAAYTVSRSRGKLPKAETKGKQVLGRSIRTARYRYTEWGDTAEFGIELYDYQDDPEELTNLARRVGHEQTLKQMRQRLHKARKLANSPVPAAP